MMQVHIILISQAKLGFRRLHFSVALWFPNDFKVYYYNQIISNKSVSGIIWMPETRKNKKAAFAGCLFISNQI